MSQKADDQNNATPRRPQNPHNPEARPRQGGPKGNRNKKNAKGGKKNYSKREMNRKQGSEAVKARPAQGRTKAAPKNNNQDNRKKGAEPSQNRNRSQAQTAPADRSKTKAPQRVQKKRPAPAKAKNQVTAVDKKALAEVETLEDIRNENQAILKDIALDIADIRNIGLQV